MSRKEDLANKVLLEIDAQIDKERLDLEKLNKIVEHHAEEIIEFLLKKGYIIKGVLGVISGMGITVMNDFSVSPDKVLTLDGQDRVDELKGL